MSSQPGRSYFWDILKRYHAKNQLEAVTLTSKSTADKQGRHREWRFRTDKKWMWRDMVALESTWYTANLRPGLSCFILGCVQESLTSHLCDFEEIVLTGRNTAVCRYCGIIARHLLMAHISSCRDQCYGSCCCSSHLQLTSFNGACCSWRKR